MRICRCSPKTSLSVDLQDRKDDRVSVILKQEGSRANTSKEGCN